VLPLETALRDPQQWNRYAYARNNPLIYTDPDGRVVWWIAAAAGGAAFGGGLRIAENLYDGRAWHDGVARAAAVGAVTSVVGGALLNGVTRAASVAIAASRTAQAIGYAEGTAGSAFVRERLQHASRHLTESGLLPGWSGKEGGQLFVKMGVEILENPMKTFDHILGGVKAKGFYGQINGEDVVFLVYKEGERAGQIATAFVPSAAQIAQWLLR
jgi:hypothetical protein